MVWASRLQKVQSELEAAQNDYKSIQTKLSATEQQIKDNTVILSSAEKVLAERGVILNRRIRDIYKNGQLSYLDVLLGANDFSDFATRVDILQRVVQKDLDLIIKVRAERLLILQTRETLERDRAAILEMKQVVEDKKNIIESSKKELEKLLDKAVGERKESEDAYQGLLQSSRNIAQMIRRNQLPKGEQRQYGGDDVAN